MKSGTLPWHFLRYSRAFCFSDFFFIYIFIFSPFSFQQSMKVVSLCNRLSRSILLRRSCDILGSRNSSTGGGGEVSVSFPLSHGHQDLHCKQAWSWMLANNYPFSVVRNYLKMYIPILRCIYPFSFVCSHRNKPFTSVKRENHVV